MAFADEDIKIYQGEPDEDAAPGEGEQSAARYVEHRDNGNLEKTRELGELLAQTLVGDACRLEGDPYRRQKLVLLSFLVTDELEAGVPDDMLRRSAAAAYRNRVEKLDPELFAVITDSASMSLYILDDRQTGSEGCGEVLAELCDRDGDRELIDGGNALAAEYRKLFSGIIGSYTFK